MPGFIVPAARTSPYARRLPAIVQRAARTQATPIANVTAIPLEEAIHAFWSGLVSASIDAGLVGSAPSNPSAGNTSELPGFEAWDSLLPPRA